MDFFVNEAAGIVFLGRDAGWTLGRMTALTFLEKFVLVSFFEPFGSDFLEEFCSVAPSLEMRPSSLVSRVLSRRSAIFSYGKEGWGKVKNAKLKFKTNISYFRI